MTVSDLKEQPFPLDNAVHNAMDYERKAGYEPATPADRYTDVKALMRVRTRKWLQEDWEGKTAEGVRYAYSHGGTMQNALGHKFDEGDCAWLKPTENTYDLAEAVTALPEFFLSGLEGDVVPLDFVTSRSMQPPVVAFVTELVVEVYQTVDGSAGCAGADLSLEILAIGLDVFRN